MQADSDSRCRPASLQLDTLFKGKPLDKLATVEVAKVVATISQWANKSCELDPLSTWLLKQAHIRHGLDESVLKNYRLVSNLPFVSKILEKVISNRLADHLALNNVIDVMQSAYRPLHSTATA